MKMSLEEATMKALLGELEDKEPKDDVEGIVDGIMVVTDPEITPDEYEEVIDKAQEILEDTPEGEVPFNDQYVGEYLLTCPICGSSFINKDVLNVGDSCPICTEVPEQGFILNGQVATQEDVELQNNIQNEEAKSENDDVNIGFEEEEVEEEPISREDVEETEEELLASEVQRTADNKLEENKELNEAKENYVKRPEQLNEVKEIKTENVSFSNLEEAGADLWGSEDVVVEDTIIDGIYNCYTARHGGYLVDTDIFPQLTKYGAKTSVNNIVGFEEDYEALKILWIFPMLINNEDFKNKLDLDMVLHYEDSLNDDFRKEFPTMGGSIIVEENKKVKTEGTNKYIPAEEKLEAIYDDYKNQGMSKNYWVDLLNIIDDFSALNRWFDASYPEEDDKDLNENKEFKTERTKLEEGSTNIESKFLDYVVDMGIVKEDSPAYNMVLAFTKYLSTDDLIDFARSNDYIDLEEDEEDLDEDWEKLEEEKPNDSEYTLINADEDKIKELEADSAFTWEGMDTSDKNLQAIVDFFKKNTPTIKLPINFYTWKGKLFNEMYSLTESNAYPEDLNFLSIALDNWGDGSFGALPMIKFQVGARWLDDIVDNNAARQGKVEESLINREFICK